VWQAYTIRNSAKPTRRNALGTQMWGPSGAPIWSAPTIDSQRQTIYVATGNNYSDPSTTSSDAVIALRMDTGKVLWTKQFT
jgi:polyvinyl alcohol dehydrogenase (cytochrome)